MLDISSGQSGCVTSFAITEKLIARRALLPEVQRVTSPRLEWLRCFNIVVFHILPSEPHPDYV